MNAHQNFAFGQLLAAWRRRDDARRQGDVGRLAAARWELERARATVRSSLDPLS